MSCGSKICRHFSQRKAGHLVMGDLAASSAEKKRKRPRNEENDREPLEIDISAPEPASKKALRKAKRAEANSVEVKGESGTTNSKDAKVPEEAAKAKVSPGRSPHGIWIGNLPFFVTKEDLQAFITGDTDNEISSDQILRIHLPQGPPKPGRRFQNKGFAYIDFPSAEAVEKALHLSEQLLGGRRVLIKTSNDFQGRPEATSKTSKLAESSSKRIFVGNLEFDISKEDLQRHFEVCGPIRDVHVATFEDSGKCKGYAWVEFEQLHSAQSAMRGWMEVGNALQDNEKENTLVEGDSKRPKKRIWVNKMGGRRLRMEFAEDKAIRYKKRFGKESRPEGDKIENTNVSNQHSTDHKHESDEKVVGDSSNSEERPKKQPKVSGSHRLRSGYSASTVQKMIGAIAEGQGTKVTFD